MMGKGKAGAAAAGASSGGGPENAAAPGGGAPAEGVGTGAAAPEGGAQSSEGGCGDDQVSGTAAKFKVNLQSGPHNVVAKEHVYTVEELLALKDDNTESPEKLKASFSIVHLPEGKPPGSGYKCDICEKPGGEADSHWKKFCPRIHEPGFDPSKHFKAPEFGYICKYCHQRGAQ